MLKVMCQQPSCTLICDEMISPWRPLTELSRQSNADAIRRIAFHIVEKAPADGLSTIEHGENAREAVNIGESHRLPGTFRYGASDNGSCYFVETKHLADTRSLDGRRRMPARLRSSICMPRLMRAAADT